MPHRSILQVESRPVTRRWQKVVAEGVGSMCLLCIAALSVHEANVAISDAIQIHVRQPSAMQHALLSVMPD